MRPSLKNSELFKIVFYNKNKGNIMNNFFKKISIEEIVIMMLVVSNFLYFNSSQKYKTLYESQLNFSENSFETPTPNRQATITDQQAEKLNPNYFEKQRANILSKTIYEKTNQFLKESGMPEKVNSVFFVVEQLPYSQLAKVNSCQYTEDGLDIILNVSPEVIQHQNQLESEMLLMHTIIYCLKKKTIFI